MLFRIDMATMSETVNHQRMHVSIRRLTAASYHAMEGEANILRGDSRVVSSVIFHPPHHGRLGPGVKNGLNEPLIST